MKYLILAECVVLNAGDKRSDAQNDLAADTKALDAFTERAHCGPSAAKPGMA